MVGFDLSRPHQLMGLDYRLFVSSIGCRRSVQMREQSINLGCMARLECLLPAPKASWAGSILRGWRSARAGLVAGSGLAQACLNALSHRFQHPTLPSTPLHSTHSTSQLLPSFSRRVDVMTTSSSFQHLHLHIPIQNPHLYEIDACYAGSPRNQQFLIQLFARTPTRAGG
jgi:hypothetical protein